jgi:hypothetical protein
MSTYEPIASQTLGGTASSVTFSSIPQNYTDLVLVVSGAGNNDVDWRIRFGQGSLDSSSSYSQTTMFGSSTTATSYREANTSGIGTGGILTTNGVSIIQIMNYSNSAVNKTILVRTNSSLYVQARVGLWRNTQAINILQMYPDSGTFNSGTTFTLYGIAAGNSSAKASGGNIVTTDGTYWYHTFTSSGAFTPNEALSVDYLVVAGGGGGGTGDGDTAQGGGGAGGYRTSIGGSQLSLVANTYPVIVGAGGVTLSNGTDSVFGSITSTGGGRGAAFKNTTIGGYAASVGGSGGGGSLNFPTGAAGNTPSTSPSQGNNGGNQAVDIRSGGGGGGASAVGQNNPSIGTGGAGGAGSANSISGTSVTYAGGGGGGGQSTGGAGGAGGGGAGASSNGNGINGTARTGGGGGGQANSSSSPNAFFGGSGGSGIVIIRYAV